MKQLLIHLTEAQIDFLQDIKERSGVSMSSYIRLLLDCNITKDNSTSFMMVEERHEIRKTTSRYVCQEQGNPTWKAIRKELSPILEKRKKQSEQWMIQ